MWDYRPSKTHDGKIDRLPGGYPEPDYIVAVWVSRNKRRWTVNLRCYDGSYVVLAEYRTYFFANRFVIRSYQLMGIHRSYNG